MRLIVLATWVKPEALAEACGMKPEQFNTCAKAEIRRSHGVDLPKKERKSSLHFSDADFVKLARFLGEKCGEAEGFSSVGAMILYARQHYTVPDGEKWTGTDRVGRGR